MHRLFLYLVELVRVVPGELVECVFSAFVELDLVCLVWLVDLLDDSGCLALLLAEVLLGPFDVLSHYIRYEWIPFIYTGNICNYDNALDLTAVSQKREYRAVN